MRGKIFPILSLRQRKTARQREDRRGGKREDQPGRDGSEEECDPVEAPANGGHAHNYLGGRDQTNSEPKDSDPIGMAGPGSPKVTHRVYPKFKPLKGVMW